MTIFLLIRHALTHADPSSISGRTSGVHLSEAGRLQADRLGSSLSAYPISTIASSPLERTLETAERIAQSHDLSVQSLENLNELDYGDWTNKTFAQLAEDPLWRRFNEHRSLTRIPAGETILEVQNRAMAALMRLGHPDSRFVGVVSHADVIRSILCFCLGVSIDLMLRISISHASLSAVRFSSSGLQVLCVNQSLDTMAALQ